MLYFKIVYTTLSGLEMGQQIKKKITLHLKDCCSNYETFCYTYCYFYSSWLCWGPKYKEFVVIVCFFKVSKPDIIQNILRQIFSTEHFELFREIARRYLWHICSHPNYFVLQLVLKVSTYAKTECLWILFFL